MSKPPGRCIFCGNLGVTKEHLFSDWLGEFFPRSSLDTHTIGETHNWSASEPPRYSERVKMGHSGTRRVRKVCANCNNTWISRIDEGARRVAPPIFLNQITTVTPDIQSIIAAWATKIAMVGDAASADRSVVSQEHRDWIRINGTPPMGWEVWIGNYIGSKWAALGANSFSGVMNIVAPAAKVGYQGFGVFTTLCIGSLLIQVMGCGIADAGFSIGPSASSLARIWPKQSDLIWPRAPFLGDDDAEEIFQMPRRLFSQPIYLLDENGNPIARTSDRKDIP